MDVYAGAVGMSAFIANVLIFVVSNHVFDRSEPYSDEALMYNQISLVSAGAGLIIVAVTLTCIHPLLSRMMG